MIATPLTGLYTTAPPSTGYVDYYIRNLNGIVDQTRTEFTNTTNIWFWAGILVQSPSLRKQTKAHLLELC